jgi:hypothetical protein
MFLACLFTYYIKISNLMGRFFTFLVLLEVLENGFYGRFGVEVDKILLLSLLFYRKGQCCVIT